MSKPLVFTPNSVDPKLELQRRLEAAPIANAEALLVAYDILNEAHRQGLLDALHGAIGAKDAVFQELAKYADAPETIHALRNLLVLGKLLGSLDPEPFSKLAKETATTGKDDRKQMEPPSLWQLFKRTRQPEIRRGLSFFLSAVQALGLALSRERPNTKS